jgi:hypothetical protein
LSVLVKNFDCWTCHLARLCNMTGDIHETGYIEPSEASSITLLINKFVHAVKWISSYELNYFHCLLNFVCDFVHTHFNKNILLNKVQVNISTVDSVYFHQAYLPEKIWQLSGLCDKTKRYSDRKYRLQVPWHWHFVYLELILLICCKSKCMNVNNKLEYLMKVFVVYFMLFITDQAFILISLITNYVFWIATWLIVTNPKIDTRAFSCKVTHQGHTLNYWIKMADDHHWLRYTKRSLLELYWSSGKGLNTNKHVNGFLLKYSIVQNVSKCLIRLSPHDVSTSICKNNQLVQRCIGFFFSPFFFYQF